MKSAIRLLLAFDLMAAPAVLRAQQPTADDARSFMAVAESTLADLSIKWNQAGWVAATYITHDTEALSAEAQREFAVAVQRFATEAQRFDSITSAGAPKWPPVTTALISPAMASSPGSAMSKNGWT
jgi:hypothetical protein